MATTPAPTPVAPQQRDYAQAAQAFAKQYASSLTGTGSGGSDLGGQMLARAQGADGDLWSLKRSWGEELASSVFDDLKFSLTSIPHLPSALMEGWWDPKIPAEEQAHRRRAVADAASLLMGAGLGKLVSTTGRVFLPVLRNALVASAVTGAGTNAVFEGFDREKGQRNLPMALGIGAAFGVGGHALMERIGRLFPGAAGRAGGLAEAGAGRPDVPFGTLDEKAQQALLASMSDDPHVYWNEWEGTDPEVKKRAKGMLNDMYEAWASGQHPVQQHLAQIAGSEPPASAVQWTEEIHGDRQLALRSLHVAMDENGVNTKSRGEVHRFLSEKLGRNITTAGPGAPGGPTPDEMIKLTNELRAAVKKPALDGQEVKAIQNNGKIRLAENPLEQTMALKGARGGSFQVVWPDEDHQLLYRIGEGKERGQVSQEELARLATMTGAPPEQLMDISDSYRYALSKGAAAVDAKKRVVLPTWEQVKGQMPELIRNEHASMMDQVIASREKSLAPKTKGQARARGELAKEARAVKEDRRSSVPPPAPSPPPQPGGPPPDANAMFGPDLPPEGPGPGPPRGTTTPIGPRQGKGGAPAGPALSDVILSKGEVVRVNPALPGVKRLLSRKDVLEKDLAELRGEPGSAATKGTAEYAAWLKEWKRVSGELNGVHGQLRKWGGMAEAPASGGAATAKGQFGAGRSKKARSSLFNAMEKSEPANPAHSPERYLFRGESRSQGQVVTTTWRFNKQTKAPVLDRVTGAGKGGGIDTHLWKETTRSALSNLYGRSKYPARVVEAASQGAAATLRDLEADGVLAAVPGKSNTWAIKSVIGKMAGQAKKGTLQLGKASRGVPKVGTEWGAEGAANRVLEGAGVDPLELALGSEGAALARGKEFVRPRPVLEARPEVSNASPPMVENAAGELVPEPKNPGEITKEQLTAAWKQVMGAKSALNPYLTDLIENDPEKALRELEQHVSDLEAQAKVTSEGEGLSNDGLALLNEAIGAQPQVLDAKWPPGSLSKQELQQVVRNAHAALEKLDAVDVPLDDPKRADFVSAARQASHELKNQLYAGGAGHHERVTPRQQIETPPPARVQKQRAQNRGKGRAASSPRQWTAQDEKERLELLAKMLKEGRAQK